MGLLLDTITTRARKTFGDDITSGNFRAWAVHWFRTAREFQIMVAREGLAQTSDAIEDIIAEQIKICGDVLNYEDSHGQP